MELLKEILINVLKNENVNVNFPNFAFDLSNIVESESYKALQKIKAIIDDDSLRDEECFKQIEEIVRVFEYMGSNRGSRHAFGEY